MPRRLPKYCQSFKDRHGHWRCYLRKRGIKLTALPGVPWSAEFMDAYAAVLAGKPMQPKITVPVAAAGTVNELWNLYCATTRFTTLDPSTQRTYRQKMGWFLTAHGDVDVTTITADDLDRALATRADTPATANRTLSILHLMMTLAIKKKWRTDDPTLHADKINYERENHEPWDADHIAAFRSYHQTGTRPRLAFEALYATMQRRSDMVRMGRQHIRDGWLSIRQQKTKTLVEVPLLPDLLAELEQLPAGQMMLLETAKGTPFSAASFGMWFRRQCDDAGVMDRSAHGLRGSGAILRAELGFSDHEIMVWGGWKTLSEVQRYTKRVNRRKLAQRGYDKMMGAK